MRVFLLCLPALLLLPAPSDAAVIEIVASKDNTIYDFVADTLNSNGSGPSFFVGRNSQANRRRGLIAFPVPDSLPEGALIDSVELRLNLSSTNDGASREISLHRLAADWGEGASFSTGGSGARPQPGDATWIHRFHPDQPWASPGADFSGTASASILVGPEGVYSWKGAGLAADVQFWLDQPSANFGWLVRGEESANTTARRFDSRENADPGARPRLIVHYTPPVPVKGVTWSDVKSRTKTPESHF